MSQKKYTTWDLCQELYDIPFIWEKWLPEEIHEYHEIQERECNAPVALQMGVILPFISSLIGPKAKGLFFTTPSVLNLYWINIAASGTGKSMARRRLVTDPLQYIMSNCGHEMEDLEVSQFTRAGKNIIIYTISNFAN